MRGLELHGRTTPLVDLGQVLASTCVQVHNYLHAHHGKVLVCVCMYLVTYSKKDSTFFKSDNCYSASWKKKNLRNYEIA